MDAACANSDWLSSPVGLLLSFYLARQRALCSLMVKSSTLLIRTSPSCVRAAMSSLLRLQNEGLLNSLTSLLQDEKPDKPDEKGAYALVK